MYNVNGLLNAAAAAFIVCGHIFILYHKKRTFIYIFKFDL